MDKGVWEKAVRENTHEKIVGPHHRCKRRVCAMKREGVPIVERRERGGEGVY